MHEWAPEERTHILSWRLLVAPLMDHLCRIYLPRSAAVTTVGAEIARLYRSRYGVETEIVRNAPPYVELSPSPMAPDRIRLVHSGGAVAGRNLEGIIDCLSRLDDRFTLDFYLVTGGGGERYLQSLRDRAEGDDRIRFHDPVAPAQLPATLNAYDVGVYWMPPTHTNARLALPNKLFDFVQARLAVAIGPTIEMQRIVGEYGLGVVSDDFTVDACVRSLAALTAEDVAQCKHNAGAAARPLSFEQDAEVSRSIVRRLLAGDTVPTT
jgi:glycosyltransferase involved in cell wall biosynthesis